MKKILFILTIFSITAISTSCSTDEETATKKPTAKEKTTEKAAVKEIVDTKKPDTHKVVHWGYHGEGNPAKWGDLEEKFATCKTGKEQSPIDIPATAKPVTNQVSFDYKKSAINTINNGHTVQVNYDKGSSITIDKTVYNLLQFHFHSPSEHKKAGKASALEMHLVHADKDGNLAVVGVMFDIAKEDNAFLASFWNDMPQKVGKATLKGEVAVNTVFDTKDEMYHYAGSLTTPPCSEKVKWYVMKKHSTVSEAQVKKFVDLIGQNARPVQDLNARTF